MQHPASHQMDKEMAVCIRNCQDCHQSCLETQDHCLHMGGKHVSPDHIRLLQDCAQICQTSADFMIRGSSLHPRTCAVCAEVCQCCAEDCLRLAADDPEMKPCAEVCQRCSESCRKMAATRAA